MGDFSWIAFGFAIVFSVVWTMFMYRMRKGTYKVIGATETATLLKTSVGEFRLDKKHGRLQVRQGKQPWTGILTDDIRELSYQRTEEPAWFWEIITGFNLWDFSGRYRDQNILFKINIVRKDGTYIPVYEASQLEEREFWLWGWWVRTIRSLFEFFNLIKDVESHSLDVYENLKYEFRKLGVVQ